LPSVLCHGDATRPGWIPAGLAPSAFKRRASSAQVGRSDFRQTRLAVDLGNRKVHLKSLGPHSNFGRRDRMQDRIRHTRNLPLALSRSGGASQLCQLTAHPPGGSIGWAFVREQAPFSFRLDDNPAVPATCWASDQIAVQSPDGPCPHQVNPTYRRSSDRHQSFRIKPPPRSIASY